MKKQFLFLLFLLSGMTGAAQNVVFHAGGGWASRYDSETRLIGAFKLGLGYEIEMNGMWSIEPSLVYYAKGWKNKDRVVNLYDDDGNLVYDDNGNVRTGKMNVTCNANYIELPVMFNYYITLSQPHYLVLSAGPYAAVGVGGKTKTRGDTEQKGAERFFYSHSTFDLSDMHRFDAGLSVGVAYELNRKFDAGFSADFGLTNVNDAGRKNVSVILSLAYKI
jgi:hypothetical protein